MLCSAYIHKQIHRQGLGIRHEVTWVAYTYHLSKPTVREAVRLRMLETYLPRYCGRMPTTDGAAAKRYGNTGGPNFTEI